MLIVKDTYMFNLGNLKLYICAIKFVNKAVDRSFEYNFFAISISARNNVLITCSEYLKHLLISSH